MWHFGNESMDWQITLRLGGETYVSNRTLVLAQKLAFADPLPRQAAPGSFKGFKAAFNRPARRRFRLQDMIDADEDDYLGLPISRIGPPITGQDLAITDLDPREETIRIVFAQKELDFLRRRIPEELLSFALTTDPAGAVAVYRDETRVGLLMPQVTRFVAPREMLKLAESGLPWAQVDMALYYQIVPEDKVPNLKEAMYWLGQALRQHDPDALTWVGVMYATGRDVPKDPIKALVLLNAAVERGADSAERHKELLLSEMSDVQKCVALTQLELSRPYWRVRQD